MTFPFELLGISPTCDDDDEIRRAYLRQVRIYTPDRDGERFQQIRRAYEQLATQRDRLRYRLFAVPEADVIGLQLALLPQGVSSGKPSWAVLQEVLKAMLVVYAGPKSSGELDKP